MSRIHSISIRAFKAVDDTPLCEAFIIGHRKVLSSYNIPKITSDTDDWIQNPDMYIIIVEAPDGQVVGGAKIQIKNEEYALPIEEAFHNKYEDFRMWMTRFEGKRIGEMCGLWNAKEIAGSGVSLLLTRSIMAKSGIVLANQLGLNSLLSLCAPWTIQLVKEFGFDIATEIGNNGAYPYPKPDLPATVMFIEDTDQLQNATPLQRNKVFDLREIPVQTEIEERNGIQMEVDYNLIIPNLVIPKFLQL